MGGGKFFDDFNGNRLGEHPDTYNVVAPPNANHAPPGPYMLFVTDSTGAYSVAARVFVTAS